MTKSDALAGEASGNVRMSDEKMSTCIADCVVGDVENLKHVLKKNSCVDATSA